MADNSVLTRTQNVALADADPEIFGLVEAEKERQFEGIELIASENFVSQAVLEALGSCLTNKYSEGLPGKRYYGGNAVVDTVENICRERALALFGLDPEEWAVNVQPYSGSPANFAAYCAMLEPHDRFMGLDLPSGGHLTHGYQTAKRKISATSVFWESLPYRVHPETGLIDYDELERCAALFRPKLLVCGSSAYARDWDYARFREIADQHSAFLMCDMAHYAGLVSAGVMSSPFEFCDVVTTTTHKSLRGPRSAMIFSRRTPRGKRQYEGLAEAVDFAVFPGLQGGPHNHQVAAVAVALKEANTEEFKEYARQVVKNAQHLAGWLTERGYTVCTGGTDSHLILWDTRPQDLTGSKVEYVLEQAAVSVNKNSVPGDKSALSPGGIRVGTPAMTSRGMVEADFEKVGEFLVAAVELASQIQETAGRRLVDFKPAVDSSEEVKALRAEVEAFAKTFAMPGFDAREIVHPESA